MSKDAQTDQAALIAGMRHATAQKVADQERSVMLQIAGIALAIFIALFSVLYVTTAEPPLPDYEVTLACDKTPKTRTVIIGAKTREDALGLVKAQFPGCGIAPKKAEAAAAGGEPLASAVE